MKKIFTIILLFICLLIINVKAANYEFKELIPVNIKTTLVTNNFSYRNFYYNGSGNINFNSIKNLSKEELPISISIALFDENKKNMGVINYCDSNDKLKSKEEKEYNISIESSEVSEGKSINDIKYIAILSDNINCNTNINFDYVGSNVEDIGKGSTTTLDDSTNRTLRVLTIVGVLLLMLFMYKFLFTGRYQNLDGEDLRKGYDSYNKDLKKQREEELKNNPPKEKEIIKNKSDEVIEQEEKAKKEDKSDTDLHKLYK